MSLLVGTLRTLDTVEAIEEALIACPEICHTAREDNENVAYCGVDLTNESWCTCNLLTGVCRARQQCTMCEAISDEEDELDELAGGNT